MPFVWIPRYECGCNVCLNSTIQESPRTVFCNIFRKIRLHPASKVSSSTRNRLTTPHQVIVHDIPREDTQRRLELPISTYSCKDHPLSPFHLLSTVHSACCIYVHWLSSHYNCHSRFTHIEHTVGRIRVFLVLSSGFRRICPHFSFWNPMQVFRGDSVLMTYE